MAQIEVAEILMNHYPKFLSYVEIMEETDCKKASVLQSLRKLRVRNEVEYKILREKGKTYYLTYYRMRRQ